MTETSWNETVECCFSDISSLSCRKVVVRFRAVDRWAAGGNHGEWHYRCVRHYLEQRRDAQWEKLAPEFSEDAPLLIATED